MPFRPLLASALLASTFLVTLAHSATAQRGRSTLDRGEVKMYAELLAMTDTRQLDTSLVDGLLAAGSPAVRAAAALAIGQVGSEWSRAGAPRLLLLLRDKDPHVASNAAYALGLLHDSAAIAELSEALTPEPAVAHEAAWALGEIGERARAALTRALGFSYDDGTTIQLLLAAAKLRPIPLTAVRRYLGAENPSVVWAAAYAIARQRAPAGIRDLIELEQLPSARQAARRTKPPIPGPYDTRSIGAPQVRAEIARALTKAAAGDSLRQRAYSALTRLVKDDDAHVRINALRSLSSYGPQAKPLLVVGTRDADPNVRIAAAQSIGPVMTASDKDFDRLWSADTSIVYRASLLASAVRAGMRPSQLAQWAKSTDWRLRAAVANAAGDSLDRAFALSRTIPLLADADPRVRESAYAAIAPPASMPLEDSVHVMLIHGLQDPDFYVRATVIGALTDRPSAKDLRAVMASYRTAARDSANDARIAALQYVTALWKKDSASIDPTLRADLARETAPRDPLERAVGKELPFWKSWGTIRPSARPAAWYENVVRSMVVPSLVGRRPRATIQTVRGPIELELFGDDAPITAWNFLTLARSGYYRNTRFHRVVPNFVAQDGDPRDDGNGGPGYAIRDEMNPNRYERGAVGMALSGPDTGGSQYFITHSPQPHLDGHYTVFGKVIRGYDVLDKIVQGDLISRVDAR
ncbi:MAG TPA: peptidylprolyl isomerase [Gemmatimonadaceae bacterium]|nr:peptidylprolyl isomerase [Gemmatimonadaceae bacterium]